MTEPIAITIPLINPNEPGALLAHMYVSPGNHVTKGDRICTLETTKSTVELTAETDGFFVGSAFSQGQTVQAGDILGYLADSADWIPPAKPLTRPGSQLAQGQGVRISRAALTLAQEHNLDLSQFSNEVFITEKLVRELIDQVAQPAQELDEKSYQPNDLIVYGGGGHGKALVELIQVLGSFSIIGIIDDGLQAGGSIMGNPVLGGARLLDPLRKHGLHMAANAVGGIGNITSRIEVFERLTKAGFTCPTLVHPTAFIEPSATLAEGVQVLPHAYVGSDAVVGFGAIVNTGAIVSHDCRLGDYANLSPGAILAGEVTVGRATLVGMGVTVNLRVKIGAYARIGNSATVKQDVPEGGIVRAGSIWPE